MTDISTNIELIAKKDTIEPEEYFTVLKNSASIIDAESLQAQMNYVASEIRKAKRLGQTNFADWLEFSAGAIAKELALASLGFDKWVARDAVAKMIDKVTPKHSVKIIELERYPRIIPDHAAAAIEQVRNEGLFDGILIVFTDLTKNDYKTIEEKNFVARNRDPIAFGYFKHDKTGETHHRLYFIADWADSQCDLSLDKLLDQVDKGEWGQIRLEDISAPAPEKSLFERVLSWMRM